MKFFFSALFLLVLSNLSAQSLTEEDKVKQSITRFFDGMRQSDSSLIRSSLAPKAILQTVARNKEGQTIVRTDDLEKFISAISTPHNEVYDERIKFDLIKIDDGLAMAWTPYQFYLGTKFSHCGVNSFQLVKLAGEWKIQYIIDTRRKEGCL